MSSVDAGLSPSWIAFSYKPCYHEDTQIDVLNTTIKYISNVVGYLPGVSVVTGLSRIIFASISMAYSENERDYLLAKGHLLKGVIETVSIFGIILLVADVWNTFSNGKPSDVLSKVEKESTLLKVVAEKEESISVEEIEQSDYRPLYKKILPDENGRQKQRLLHSNHYQLWQVCENELKKDWEYKYKTGKEQQQLRDAFAKKSNALVVFDELRDGEYFLKDLPKEMGFMQAFPVGKIDQNTTLNQFWMICKQSPDYQLHHANGGHLPKELIRTSGVKNDGLNAISAAIRMGNVELLRGLLDIAPELVNLEGIEGVTPLMFACAFKNPDIAFEMAEIILQNKEVNVNLCTISEYFTECNLGVIQGATALWIATSMKNHKLVELLVSHEAKLPNKLTSYEFIKESWKWKVSVSPSHPKLVDFVLPYVCKLFPFKAVEKSMPLVKMRDNGQIPNDVFRTIVILFHRVYLESFY